VRRHFQDLAMEEGNRDLSKVFEFIRRSNREDFKKILLGKDAFEKLLKSVIEKYANELEYKTIDDLKNLLIVNGIVSERDAEIKYRFTFLYKYCLELRDKKKRPFASWP
jgi:hypothetical protein